MFIAFLYGYQDRILNAFSNPVSDILIVMFVIIVSVIAVLTIIKSLSLIPVLGMSSCLYLMVEIPAKSWLVFFGWMTLGLVIYFLYGYRRSHLNTKTA
jgi:APA family basic amino acid/polyamine antiporter